MGSRALQLSLVYDLGFRVYSDTYKHHSGSLIVINSQNGDLLLSEMSTENFTVLPANGCRCHLPLSAASCWQMQPQQQCSDCVLYNSQYFVFAIIFKLVLHAY